MTIKKIIQNKTNDKLTLVFLLALFSSITLSPLTVRAAEYSLVIEPTYPIEQGKQVYEPLRAWLSKKTGHDIKIIIDNNYFFYWRSAMGGRTPDFTFDPPHIASYRMEQKDYLPIATTIEPSFFHLVSLEVPQKGEKMEKFMVGKKVIMIPNPSLASIFFNKWFTDLFAAPSKVVTALSWQDAVEIVFDGGADAAITPEWMLDLYPNFESLKKSEELPGPTFLASPSVPKDVRESLQKALISLVDEEAAYEVLVELNTEGFKKPDVEKFKGLKSMLPGIR